MQLSDVKRVIAYRLPVAHNGTTYDRVAECIMWLDGEEWKYSLLLVKGNGATRAGIEEVEPIDKA